MSDIVANEIAATIRKLGKAKTDPVELLLVEGLKSRGIPEHRARAAARECSNRIWTNSMFTGSAAVVLVSAAGANLPGAIAGGAAASLGLFYTLMLSTKCSGVRQLNGFDLLTNLNDLLTER